MSAKSVYFDLPRVALALGRHLAMQMIESNKPTLWLCTKCWRIMPRADAEKLSLAQGASSGTADWNCSSCGAIGQFASDSSPQFAEFANDLVFEALAASIREAGYEVLAYSAQCDKGDHGHCPGTNNRLTAECLCECHRSAYVSRLREPD
jgi:hypothetical protein